MPELPEVETVRRSILPVLLHRAITRARLFRRDVLTLEGEPPGGWSRQRAPAPAPRRHTAADLLVGERIASVERHGKQLALVAESGRVLGVQLGMSGALTVLPPRARADPAHLHAAWWTDAGDRLLFHDPRRFGGLWALPSRDALHARWAALGPDALAITADQLRPALAHARRPTKAALLDQTVLAGVGNIYADEALFLARIAPLRLAASLTAPEVDALAHAIRTVLAAAVAARGSTLRDYRDADGRAGSYQASHAVYGRAGLPCPRCGATLVSTQAAQRTTVWCPRCQPDQTPTLNHS